MAKVGSNPIPAKLVYCGPNIPGGALQQFTVFKEALPMYLNEMVEKCPAIAILSVPPDQLQITRNAIGTKGSAANIAYGQIVNFIKQGGK